MSEKRQTEDSDPVVPAVVTVIDVPALPVPAPAPEGSLLDQAQDVLARREQDELEAAITERGVEARVQKTVGKGWAVVAWVQRLWGGKTRAGAGVTKKL